MSKMRQQRLAKLLSDWNKLPVSGWFWLMGAQDVASQEQTILEVYFSPGSLNKRLNKQTKNKSFPNFYFYLSLPAFTVANEKCRFTLLFLLLLLLLRWNVPTFFTFVVVVAVVVVCDNKCNTLAAIKSTIVTSALVGRFQQSPFTPLANK